MTYLKRSVDDAIAWSKSQIDRPTQNWSNMCQSHCRQAYGVPAWASSAKIAWNTIPSREKHAGGKPFDAPRGALIYFDSGTYGHVAIATGKSTNDKCLSNDYMRQGQIDYAPRDFPRWGLHYAGWSFWTPYGELRPDEPKPMWDGKVPDIEGIFNAQNHSSLVNPASYRLACRLFDLGMFVGIPTDTQKYPARAVGTFTASRGWAVNPSGAYSPEAHAAIFS